MTAQTSEQGGFIRGVTGEIDAGGDPISSAIVRALVNNGLHLLDEFGQALVSEHAVAVTDFQGSASTTMTLIPGCEWDCQLRIRHGDTTSYRVVVYFRGSISAAGTATFRLSLRPPQQGPLFGVAPVDPATLSTTYTAEVSTTSTSGADLAATLYLPASIVASARLGEIPSEDGSGDETTAFQLSARLQIWATSSSAGFPRVLAITAREFAGDR